MKLFVATNLSNQVITKYPITKATIVATRVSASEKTGSADLSEIALFNWYKPLPNTAGIASKKE